MRNLVTLLAESLVELRLAMAVNIAPKRRNAVEVTTPARVKNVVPLASFDDDWFFRSPVLHLGKRMPEETLVPGGQLSRRMNSHFALGSCP